MEKAAQGAHAQRICVVCARVCIKACDCSVRWNRFSCGNIPTVCSNVIDQNNVIRRKEK